LDNKGRKEVYDTLTGLFTEKLTQIYSLAMKQSTWPWPGSDIWRFFKDDVKDYCVERDTNYRNILIILTDGYIFHEDSKIQNGNRYTYLLTENIRPYRAPANWKQQIDGNNFGLITERNDLKDLEVLVLEISAGTIKKDEDILKYVIQKWLGEMKVPHSAIYSSDLPSNTKTRIENFLNEK
jgi:hypothetical protein